MISMSAVVEDSWLNTWKTVVTCVLYRSRTRSVPDSPATTMGDRLDRVAMMYRTRVEDVDNWPENICKIGNICQNSV